MKLTKRLENLKDRLFNIDFYDPGVWHFTNVNILDGNEELASEPIVVRKGMAQKYIGNNLPAVIKENELIVGNPNMNSVAWGTVIPKYYTKEEGEQAARYEISEASVWGHHPPQWDKIINKGIITVKKEVNEAIEKQLRSLKPDEMALNEYRAMLIALDGIVDFAHRHAEVALKKALECKDEIRKKELYQIYEVCSHVPLNPARNLHEAIQSYWFTYCIVNSSGEFVPLARMDKYLYPFFEKDLKNEKITKERAIDLIGCFLVKCNEKVLLDQKKAENHYNFGLFSQGVIPDEQKAKTITGGFEQRGLEWREDEDINSENNYNYGQSGNNWLMNCIIGGQYEDGSDATNEVTILIIDLMAEMKLLMPTLSVRIHKNSPEILYNKLSEAAIAGKAIDTIYCDETIIPGFVDLGIPVEEARDYTNDGCWETLIPGKSHFSYAHVMVLKCLEWVLFRGISLSSNQLEGLDTGDPRELKTFDDFYEAYKTQLNNRIDFQCKRRIENFGLTYMIAPDPLISSIIEDCVDKGRDLSQDGARYVFHLILLTGLANTVNSLAAIKKLVYEDKTATIDELIKAVKANWKGYEKLRAQVLNKVPKFGNDDDYVDSIAVQLMKDYENRVEEWRRKQNVILFPVGVGTFENYAVLGRDIGASPDGRYFGDALAPNFSPNPGSDVEGPTAVLKSITKPELLRYYCGTPVEISINSNEFEGEVGIERMKSLIKSFADIGGQMMSITCTDVNTLKEAQKKPEEYKSLRVRMGGLSAYFVSLAPVQQNNIIKRFDK